MFNNTLASQDCADFFKDLRILAFNENCCLFFSITSEGSFQISSSTVLSELLFENEVFIITFEFALSEKPIFRSWDSLKYLVRTDLFADRVKGELWIGGISCNWHIEKLEDLRSVAARPKFFIGLKLFFKVLSLLFR